MPIPKPTPTEEKAAFLDRCMANPTMESEYPDPEQRYAVCQAQWDDKRSLGNGWPAIRFP